MTRRALIFGVSGQDGSYLSRFLLGKGYEVHGTTRGSTAAAPPNHARLGIADSVTLHSLNPAVTEDVASLVRTAQPDEVYYLAGQSSVFRSFQDAVATMAGAVIGLTNVLEAVRAAELPARIFNAASGDCFGETAEDRPATEATSFRPRSPYAAAKCAGHHQLAVYRLAYGQFACSAFLFSHESPLRPEAFALGKVTAAAKRIAAGSTERLRLGNIAVVRDWGWAPDYVEAMWLMLQQDEPSDFVIASGRSHSLALLVESCFAALGLDWREHVDSSAEALRPSDIARQHADPGRARKDLGWQAMTDIEELAIKLVREEPYLPVLDASR